MTPEVDEIVMREAIENPADLYGFPKNLPPKHIPVPPVGSTPLLPYLPDDERLQFRWVIGDLGHGTLTRSFLRATNKRDILQHTSNENT